jgi:hypothetical protein
MNGEHASPPKSSVAPAMSRTGHVKTVAWSFHSPHARQRPIEAVAKPVDGQGQDNEPERTAIPARGPRTPHPQCHSASASDVKWSELMKRGNRSAMKMSKPLLCRRKDAAVSRT